MSKKTKNAKPLPQINVGDRVRHPNGTEGTVTATSGAKVTIAWPNEETTWEGSYLRIRGIKVIGDEPAAPAPVEPATTEPALVEQVEPTPAEATAFEQTPAEPAATVEAPFEQPPVEQVATEPASASCPYCKQSVVIDNTAANGIRTTNTGCEFCNPAEPTPADQSPPVEQAATETAAVADVADPATAKKPRTRKANAVDAGKEKKLSALDAAAKVLAEAGQPMTCPEMIDAMAAKGYWTSPGGQTPAATLYSAILRECSAKGAESRFVKTERGKFGRKS